MKNKTFTARLFKCEDFFRADHQDNIFYNCTLNEDIHNFKKGSIIPLIWVNYETFEITFYDKNDLILGEFKFETKII